LLAHTTPERQLASWLFARWLVSIENQAAWAEATGYLPVSTAAAQALRTTNATPALRQALPFLAYAHPEPVYASWYILRWSLAEALDQLMIADLPAARIPAILENLDSLADEVHNLVR
jgi:multiple sugar transport system substrate-binding protein/sn-glycerol 3-phosphate transport system substrate-binding protein